MQDVMMKNGHIFPKKEIGKHVTTIINRFAEEGLSVDEAKIVLKEAEELVGEHSIVKIIDS